jgi:hypothetical protein
MGYLIMIYARRPQQVKNILAEHPAATLGIYAFPAKNGGVDICPRGCPGRAWTRHRDGYMVHICGRRTRDWRRRIVGSLFDTLGLNLLPRARTPKMFQNPEGWEPTKK